MQPRGVRLIPIMLSTMLLAGWIVVNSGTPQVPTGSPSPGATAIVNPSGGSGFVLAPPSSTTTGPDAVLPTSAPDSRMVDFRYSAVEGVNGGISSTPMVNLFPLPRQSLFMQRRRNRLEIYAEIIKRLSTDPLGITEIALFCRLNFSSAKEMVDTLVSLGLLETIDVEGDLRYQATLKGSLVIQDIERVANLFQPSMHV